MAGIAYKTTAPTVSTPSTQNPVVEFDFCRFGCGYRELVFGNTASSDKSPSGADFYQNDSTSFLFRKILSTDTIALELHKDGSKVSDIVDDTYGAFYDGFTAQPLYVGLRVDWGEVLDLHGAGVYTIVANLDLLQTPTVEESREFQVAQFNPERANRTFRIETYQTGNIIGSPFDYTDLLPNGWYQSTRMQGKLGEKVPELQVDNYEDDTYLLEQIQDTVVNNYTLSVFLVPEPILDIYSQDGILANRVEVTDYYLFNSSDYRRLSLYPVSIESVEHYDSNKLVSASIKLTDRLRNLIKRNS